MSKVNARNLGRNSLFATLSHLWRIGSRFVLTPVIIAQMGMEGYGTWTLLFSVSASVAVLDTSFGLVYAKYTAEYDRRGDYEALSEILGTGIALVMAIGVVGIGVFWLFRAAVFDVLNVPDDLTESAGLALVLILSALLLRMSYGASYQVLSGLQRSDLHYKLIILASLLDFAVALPLLLAGWGLLALAIGHAIGQAIAIAIGVVVCKRFCPEVTLSPLRASREGFRRIAGLGGRFQLLSAFNTIMNEGTKVVLAALLGTAMVGVYEIAHKLTMLGKSVSGSVLAPLMPAFANLHAGRDAERARQLYVGGSKAIALFAMTCLSFLAVMADDVILMWTGEEVPLAAWTIRILAVGEFLSLLTGVATASLRGRGRVGLELAHGLLGGGTMLLAFWPLYQLLEYPGIVYARLIGAVAGASWFLLMFFRREGLSLRVYLRDVVGRVLVTGALACGAVWVVRWHIHGIGSAQWSDRWRAVLDVALNGVAFVAVIALAAWLLVLTVGERQRVARTVGSLFQRA